MHGSGLDQFDPWDAEEISLPNEQYTQATWILPDPISHQPSEKMSVTESKLIEKLGRSQLEALALLKLNLEI